MDRVAGEVASATTRWGIHIEFVKIQRVEAGELAAVLAKKKNADLQNQEIFIHARAHKQTEIIQSEGRRDMLIKEAEGEAQQIISRARGEAKAIVNAANAEASSIREVSRYVSMNVYCNVLHSSPPLYWVIARPLSQRRSEYQCVSLRGRMQGCATYGGGSVPVPPRAEVFGGAGDHRVQAVPFPIPPL